MEMSGGDTRFASRRSRFRPPRRAAEEGNSQERRNLPGSGLQPGWRIGARVVHVSVTDTPTAEWTAQQLVEAFPWDTGPRYLLRDRDAIYGAVFSSRVHSLGIQEVKIAPRSPWQNPYVERLIETLRRECLDHEIVLNETHLR